LNRILDLPFVSTWNFYKTLSIVMHSLCQALLVCFVERVYVRIASVCTEPKPNHGAKKKTNHFQYAINCRHILNYDGSLEGCCIEDSVFFIDENGFVFTFLKRAHIFRIQQQIYILERSDVWNEWVSVWVSEYW
jgi:hypothetical protein